MDSAMFNEAFQDLKDRYPDRLTLIHVLSRQAQEAPLLKGRVDPPKLRELIATLLPLGSMDEVVVCGPEAMIEATKNALLDAGLRPDRLHTERFTSPTLEALPASQRQAAVLHHPAMRTADEIALTVAIDGKPHQLRMNKGEHVLDVALDAGLDLPWSCRGGVCCTCRAKVMEGSVTMNKNFALEPKKTKKGFVLSCQAHPTSDSLVVSYDER